MGVIALNPQDSWLKKKKKKIIIEAYWSRSHRLWKFNRRKYIIILLTYNSLSSLVSNTNNHIMSWHHSFKEKQNQILHNISFQHYLQIIFQVNQIKLMSNLMEKRLSACKRQINQTKVIFTQIWFKKINKHYVQLHPDLFTNYTISLSTSKAYSQRQHLRTIYKIIRK